MHSVEVIESSNQIYTKNLQNFLKSHKSSIKFLKISSSSSSFVSLMLDEMNQLTHLTINGIKSFSSGEFSVNLPNLISLTISEPANYLKIIKNHKIEKLSIFDSEIDGTRVSRAANNFLKKCKNLKHFSYSGIFPNFDVEKFEFKLESFELFSICHLAVNNSKNSALEFLESQKEIKKLKLSGFLTREIVQFSISELELEKFSVDLEKVFANFKDLKFNKSLKILEILKLPSDIEIAKKLILHCTKIESLKISPKIVEKFENFTFEISNNLTNLKNLKLHSIPCEISDQMTFTNLKTLTVDEISNDEEIVNFIEFSFGCPNIRKIKINFENSKNSLKFDEEDLKNFLKDLKKLEILEISGKFNPTKEFFDVIYETHSNLKHLILNVPLNEENLEEINEDAKSLDEVNIKITIPELVRYKREIWESELENFDENFDENLDESDSEIFSEDEDENSSLDSDDLEEFFDYCCEDHQDNEECTENHENNSESFTEELEDDSDEFEESFNDSKNSFGSSNNSNNLKRTKDDLEQLKVNQDCKKRLEKDFDIDSSFETKDNERNSMNSTEEDSLDQDDMDLQPWHKKRKIV